MTPEFARMLIEAADATGDSARALAAVQAVRDGLDSGTIDIVRGPNALAVTTSTDRSRPFPARHAGKCQRCERPIAVGEIVTYSRVDRTVRHAPVCPGGRP